MEFPDGMLAIHDRKALERARSSTRPPCISIDEPADQAIAPEGIKRVASVQGGEQRS